MPNEDNKIQITGDDGKELLSDAELKVVDSWRFTDGKLSAAWLRLIVKLCKQRR